MSFPPPTQRQARIIWLALTGLAMATIVGLAVGLIWGAGRVLNILSPVLWPLAVAGVLAYLLDPVVDWLQAKWFSRRVSILVVFALAVCIQAALLGSVLPQLVTETRELVRTIPQDVQKLQARVEAYINNPSGWAQRLLPQRDQKPAREDGGTNAPSSAVDTNAQATVGRGPSTNAPESTTLDSQTLQSAGSWIASAAPKVGKFLLAQVGRVASWFAILAALALIPIYTYYLLLEKRGIQSNWTDYLPVADSKFKDEMVFVLSAANNYMIAFFRGQVLVAICDAIMYTIGFSLIGLRYAILLGFISVFLTLIPYIGALIISGAAIIIALVQFGDWLHPVLVLVVFGVAQLIEGFVIAPKILGDKVGLHPLTIIIAVMAGTTLLGGVLGGILAIPLTALLRVVMFRYVWKRPEPSTSES